MSLISDALKKAQLDRANAPPARASRASSDPWLGPSVPTAPVHRPSRMLLLTNLAVLALVCGGALYFVRHRPATTPNREPERSAAASPALASSPVPTYDAPPPTVSVPALSAQTSTPGREASAAAPLTSDYELAGTSMIGDKTLISIIRRSDRRSSWVQVGKTVGEITAVSYDPTQDRAVVRIYGDLRSIGVRDTAPGNSPTRGTTE